MATAITTAPAISRRVCARTRVVLSRALAIARVAAHCLKFLDCKANGRPDVAAPVMAHAGTRAAASPAATDVHTVPDAAKLLLVGTSLFGLAAAVRKAR